MLLEEAVVLPGFDLRKRPNHVVIYSSNILSA